MRYSGKRQRFDFEATGTITEAARYQEREGVVLHVGCGCGEFWAVRAFLGDLDILALPKRLKRCY